MTQNVFTVRKLSKVYGDGAAAVHALRGVDLDIPEGELVVLLGPSGSGKSTLLNIVGGLDMPHGDAVSHAEDVYLNQLMSTEDVEEGRHAFSLPG